MNKRENASLVALQTSISILMLIIITVMFASTPFVMFIRKKKMMNGNSYESII